MTIGERTYDYIIEHIKELEDYVWPYYLFYLSLSDTGKEKLFHSNGDWNSKVGEDGGVCMCDDCIRKFYSKRSKKKKKKVKK